MDARVWEEATSQNQPSEQARHITISNSITMVLPSETEYYCMVDASWKSSNENIGIGCSLFSKEGTPRLQGSSALEPTNSFLVAEAMAMLLAVQHMHVLSYNKVVFLGDNMEIMKALNTNKERGQTISIW